MKVLSLLALAAVTTAAGCTTEDNLRHEGVTGAAGNAIAANSVLQMVDPWPRGVQNTDLRLPAEMPDPSEDTGDAASATPVTLN